MPSITGEEQLVPVKCVQCWVSLAFVVMGIIMISSGFELRNGFLDKFGQLLNGDDGGYSIPSTIFIVVGFVMIIIAFLGCYGAITENHYMMMLYSALGLILVIQLSTAIAAYAVVEDNVEKVLSTGLEESADQYYNETSLVHNETVRSWDILQNSLKCCGVHNYTNWASVKSAPLTEFIPTHCCIDGAHEHCTNTITRENLMDETFAATIIYTDGCVPKGIGEFSVKDLGSIAIFFAVIPLLGVAIAGWIMARIRSIRFSYEAV